MREILVLAAVCMLLMTMPLVSQAAGYQVQDLGWLPLTEVYATVPTGINDSGTVVGYGFNHTVTHSFLWRNGVLHDIGAPAGSSNARISAISNTTNYIVGTSVDDATGRSSAFVYRGGAFNKLQVPLGYTSHWANDVNTGGTIVGTAAGPDGKRAVLWQNSTMLDLGLPYGTASEAIGINDKGQVICKSGTRIFMWQNGVTQELDTPSGCTSIDVLDINNNGQVVGRWFDGASYYGLLWQNGVMQTLPHPVSCINDLGQMMLIPDVHDPWGVPCAVPPQLWSATNLQFQQSLGYPEFMWGASNTVPGLNNKGWAIGTRTSLTTKGFLYTPVPEPSGMLALLCGLGVLGGLARRRMP